MDPKKSAEIAALAGVVRESLDLAVPVDVEEAVVRLGGAVFEVDAQQGEPEATVRRAGERFEITIRKADLPMRKRFSVAHELGHLFLHMGYLIDPDRWGTASEYRDSVYHRFGYGIEEAEANLFAAAFLMPEEEYREAIGKAEKDGEVSIKALAGYFKTSPTAAMRRGQELGLIRVNENGFK